MRRPPDSGRLPPRPRARNADWRRSSSQPPARGSGIPATVLACDPPPRLGPRARAEEVSAGKPLQRPAPIRARSGQRDRMPPIEEHVVDISQATNEPAEHGLLSAISTEMVRIYK